MCIRDSTFTLLPAVFVLVGMPGRAPDTQVASGDLAMKWLSERRTPILVGISLMTVVAAAVGSRMYFDYSVLALRDPDSESMRTLALLQEEEIVTDYTLSILTQDDQETRNLNRLLDLPTVGKVTTPFDYVPKEQDDKLFLLSEDGDTYVIQAGQTFDVIGQKPLNEFTMATPAIAHGSLFIRTASKLYRITEGATP